MAVYRKYAKKMVKKAGKAIKKRYTTKDNKVNVSRIMKDVNMLKGIINSEKFRLETAVEGQIVGQVNANTSGHYVADFTPTPSQGDGYNNRQGNSIRWKSSHYSFFFQRQGNNVAPCNIKIQLIKVIGEAYSNPSTILGRFIEPDRWVTNGTIYDTASDRKPEYFKQYRVLRTINVRFPQVSYSGIQGSSQKIVNFGLRLPSHHVKWNNNSNTLADGQVICLITMDTGNCNTTTASTLDDISNNGASTGIRFAYNRLDYYYDN